MWYNVKYVPGVQQRKGNQIPFEFHLMSLNKQNKSIIEMNTVSKFLVF